MHGLRHSFVLLLFAAGALGLMTLLAPVSFAGKGGKGGGGGPPGPGNPPDCPCADVITPAPGVVCTLDWCVEYVPGGFECGYVCTF